MLKKVLSIALILIGIGSACTPKPEKTVAIDVLLTLPEETYQQAIHLNTLIRQSHPNNFQLDANHIPHITLLQCYVGENDLKKVERELNGIFQTSKNEIITASEIHYSKDKAESFASISIIKSESLLKLHAKVIEVLKPYKVTDGTQKAYVQNPNGKPIDQFTIDYVPQFVAKHSFENYDPHISLGMATTKVLDSLAKYFKPVHFKATSLAIYQLGDAGTAQKQLWKSE